MLKSSDIQREIDVHEEARRGITHLFNKRMEKILNENKKKDVYWILGKVKIFHKNGVDVVRPFIQACDEKPSLVKESFVYEVDNRRGVKTLLWVMHPGDVLSFPTLGKSIRVSDGSKKGSPIWLPQNR